MIMAKSSVNIGVITYNQENFIKETLDSVINQTYDVSKVIVVDDGSTDNTPKIIMEYALDYPFIEPVLSKKNKGIAHNMNRALKRAAGDYFSVIAGDDLMLPYKIEKQVEYLDRNQDVVTCVHEMDVFDSSTGNTLGKFSEIMSFEKIGGKSGVESIFNPSICNGASSVMYRAGKLPKNGFDTRLKYWNDFVFDVEVLVGGKIGFIDEVLGKYRIHSANVSRSEDIKKNGLEDALIAYSIIIAKYPELYFLVKKRRTATYVAKILECIKTGDIKRAKYLSKVLMMEGSFFKGLIMRISLNVLNENRVDKLLNSQKLLRFIMKFF